MKIALIHAVAVAMQPVEDAFRRHWPQPERVNLLDDSLSVDRNRDGILTPAMKQRIATLADYALVSGAAGILYTCSAFGEAIEAVQKAGRVPVLKPNEAMFEEAARYGKRIGLLATFAPSIGSMEDEFFKITNIQVRSACADGAMKALQSGNPEKHDAMCAEAALQLKDCDAIMLAQFSTARARAAVAQAVPCPVLTSPDSAVLKMKALL